MKKNLWPSALALSLVLSLSIAGCGKPSAEAQLQKARDYLAKGEKKAAIIEFKNLLADHPDNADARRQLGQLYLETGETDAALIELKKAVEHGADKVATASMLAKALLAKGEHAKALEYLEPKTLAEAATSPALIVLRGHAFAARGMIDEANQIYVSALKIDPNFADASIGLARIAVEQRKLGEAITLLDGVLASAPKNVDALLMKGDVVRRNGDKGAAKKLYEQALAADSSKDQAYLSLISMATEADQLTEARQYLAALQKISPNNIYARHFEALILMRANQPDQALAKVLEVLKQAPMMPAANLLAANIEYSKGSYQQAVAHLNAVLANLPNSVAAQRLMVATLLKQNDIDKAGELAMRLTEQYPDDANVFNLAGEVFTRKKDYAKAITAYSRAAQLNPKSSELRTKVAMAKMATGEADEALHDLESIAAGDNKAIQADIVLALTHISKQEWKLAESAVSRLASKQPDSPLAGSLRASVLLGKNEPARARKELDAVLAKHPGFVPAAVNLARLDLAEKKPELAQQRFNSLLAKDVKNADMMMAYAEFLLAINKPADAQAWLEKAHQVQPEAVAPSLALTSLAIRNNDLKRALGIAQEALAKKPDNAQLLDNVAVVLLASGDRNQALQTLAKLVKVAPNSPFSHIKLANAQALTGNHKGAIESLQKAILIAPTSVDAHILLGRLYLKDNQVSAALKMALAVQKLQPKSAVGYLLEGDARMMEKAGSAAVAAYGRANSVEPSSTGIISLHRAMVLDGKGAQADLEMSKWLAKFPSDVPIRAYIAEQALLSKDFAKAIGLYEALIKLQPSNAMMLNNLAYCYQQAKDGRALATAERALKLQPDNAAVMDTLAMIQLGLGKSADALANLKRAQALAPDNAEIHFHYAQSLIAEGKLAEAKKELEQALTKSSSGDLRSAMLDTLKKLR